MACLMQAKTRVVGFNEIYGVGRALILISPAQNMELQREVASKESTVSLTYKTVGSTKKL